MAQIGQNKFFILMIGIFISVQSYGQQAEVDYYKSDNVTNQIPYFDNRFKIDAEIEEITLLFYRVSGTPPIILVRPDGTKLRVNNLPEDKITWYDDRTFDLITIKNPMPGPWQAIGSILPESKIMVVTDVTIKVEPLPEIILSGETLKVEGRVYNGDKAIDDPLFRDVLKLNVDFYSTNNSDFDNFGAEPIKIAQFRDDGRDLDEFSGDGLFTGEFVLNYAPGEWLPIYYVQMPMATRELRQKPIVLHKTPVTLSVEAAMEEGEFHQVSLTIDPEFVDANSVLFQGKVIFPDRQVEPFSIMEGKGNKRVYEIAYTESGVHRLQVNAFGKTTNGREFRLELPEFSFNAENKNGILIPTMDSNGEVIETNEKMADVLQNDKAKQAKEMALALEQAKIEQELAAKEKEQENLMIIIAANIGIVLLGLGFYLFSRWKKKKVS